MIRIAFQTSISSFSISDIGELTSQTSAKQLGILAHRPKTLANETLVKQLVGETTTIPLNIKHLLNLSDHEEEKYCTQCLISHSPLPFWTNFAMKTRQSGPSYLIFKLRTRDCSRMIREKPLSITDLGIMFKETRFLPSLVFWSVL